MAIMSGIGISSIHNNLNGSGYSLFQVSRKARINLHGTQDLALIKQCF